jgi:dihydrofolate reductase
MLEIIIATTLECGIGFKNNLPWPRALYKDDLGLFRMKTMDSILIVGRKTAETLPESVQNDTRQFIVVNQELPLENALQKALALSRESNRKIFIIGGAQIYTQIFKSFFHLVTKIHYTLIQDDYKCDTFVDSGFFQLTNCLVEHSQDFGLFRHYVLIPTTINAEIQYLTLLSMVMVKGKESKGRNGVTKSLFGNTLKFDLQSGFPLLTTKKMFFRGIVEELLFFLKGETDSKILEAKGVNIWKGNTSREFLDSRGLHHYDAGILGPGYGWQMRFFGAKYSQVFADTSQIDTTKIGGLGAVPPHK